jgi:hypothetical protein
VSTASSLRVIQHQKKPTIVLLYRSTPNGNWSDDESATCPAEQSRPTLVLTAHNGRCVPAPRVRATRRCAITGTTQALRNRPGSVRVSLNRGMPHAFLTPNSACRRQPTCCAPPNRPILSRNVCSPSRSRSRSASPGRMVAVTTAVKTDRTAPSGRAQRWTAPASAAVPLKCKAARSIRGQASRGVNIPTLSPVPTQRPPSARFSLLDVTTNTSVRMHLANHPRPSSRRAPVLTRPCEPPRAVNLRP